MQRESIPEVRVSVRKIKTDAIPLPAFPAPFWGLSWSALFPIATLLLQLVGFLWLLVLTVSYMQDWGFIATLPHAVFVPVYAFLVAYGALNGGKGIYPTLYRCAAASALLVAIY